MWYFIIRQQDIGNKQYQHLQQLSSLTEVEVFNEPHDNFCIFSVAGKAYKNVMDYLDTEGVTYELATLKSTRAHLLTMMK